MSLVQHREVEYPEILAAQAGCREFLEQLLQEHTGITITNKFSLG